MAGLPPRPWAQRNDSFSSLAGLEIAIPPGQQAPSSPGASSLYSQYSEKALPPIPPRSPQRKSLLSYEDMGRDEVSSPTSRSSRKVFQLMGVHVDTDTALKEDPRPQSRMSVSSSESGYSQDGLDEGYPTPLTARRPSSVEDLRALPKKSHFYLQAVTYSASAPKIEPSKSKIIPNQLKSEPLSLRHRDRVQAASPQEKSNPRPEKYKPPKPKSPQRSQTLDEMIAYERKRFQREQFAKQMWKPTVGRPEPKFFKDEPRSPTKKKGNGTIPAGYPTASTSSLAPPPLILRGREERRQSISHFSDQSDDESPGIMANARDSVMSHIRRTVKSPSPRTSTHPISFQEKHKSPARLMPPPASAKQRKRFSSKGKHPLKSPFPFQSNPPKHKKPQWPPPGQHITKSTTPSFSKRLSGVMRRFSTGSGSGSASAPGSASPMQSSSIITTESREANGPDTPLPTSSSSNKLGFMSNINITSPKFMKDLGGKEGEKTMSPKEILEKGSMRFADAIESARKKAGVKSKAEKRRDHIRANIVKIGQADVDPNGRINQWV